MDNYFVIETDMSLVYPCGTVKHHEARTLARGMDITHRGKYPLLVFLVYNDAEYSKHRMARNYELARSAVSCKERIVRVPIEAGIGLDFEKDVLYYSVATKEKDSGDIVVLACKGIDFSKDK